MPVGVIAAQVALRHPDVEQVVDVGGIHREHRPVAAVDAHRAGPDAGGRGHLRQRVQLPLQRRAEPGLAAGLAAGAHHEVGPHRLVDRPSRPRP